MSFIELSYKSESLKRTVSLNIFLPYGDGGENAEKPFKTLYFLPGFSTSRIEMCTLLSVRFQSALQGIAVVIPDGENSFYVDKKDGVSNYGDFVGREIVKVTREILPLSEKREDTYIGGISMGGYGALLNGLRNSKTFEKIIAMSPGIDFYEAADLNAGFTELYLDGIFGSREISRTSELNLQEAYLNAKRTGINIPKLFLCCGRTDELVYASDVRFVQFLQDNEIEIEYQEEDGGHDVVFWEKLLPSAFAFLKNN